MDGGTATAAPTSRATRASKAAFAVRAAWPETRGQQVGLLLTLRIAQELAPGVGYDRPSHRDRFPPPAPLPRTLGPGPAERVHSTPTPPPTGASTHPPLVRETA